MANERKAARSAAEAGWHVSRYNISAKEPETGKTVIVNLLTGSCAEYSPLELYLMSALDEISEDHPIIGLLARRGAICNFDELAAIEAESHIGVVKAPTLGLVLCPTLGCNFDCPYCFENHYAGKMSAEVQDDDVALAGRMIDASAPERMKVTWFGGEPLLAPEIVESLSQRLIALADERGIEYDAGIITNGYLLDQDIVDMLTCYLNAFGATCDPECRECVWLPHCAGGCPHMRLFGEGRQCVPYRDNPEAFVLASYAKLSAAQR